ncbi:hypothetical protein F2Q69_00046242 [Brassica cretica]|uniref:Uncharacterized protein n=1 Tax=Brassica cretica TaxID=69181 RepID=A0A8S9Q821_BRACR|nr:hypothetical protein F2Q69_00046242 [Brassica cretica]
MSTQGHEQRSVSDQSCCLTLEPSRTMAHEGACESIKMTFFLLLPPSPYPWPWLHVALISHQLVCLLCRQLDLELSHSMKHYTMLFLENAHDQARKYQPPRTILLNHTKIHDLLED